jgi:hypothetical protein
VQTSERLSLEQIQAFLEGSGSVGFEGQNREEVYGWVNQTLRQQRYEELKRSTGLSWHRRRSVPSVFNFSTTGGYDGFLSTLITRGVGWFGEHNAF